MKRILCLAFLFFTQSCCADALTRLGSNVKPFEECNFEQSIIEKFDYVVEPNNTHVLYTVHMDGSRKVLFKTSDPNVESLHGLFQIRDLIQKGYTYTWVRVDVKKKGDASYYTHLVYIPLKKDVVPADLGYHNSNTKIFTIGFEYVPELQTKIWTVYLLKNKQKLMFSLLDVEGALLKNCGGIEKLPEWFESGQGF